MYISDLCFGTSCPSRVQSILNSYGHCSYRTIFTIICIYSAVGCVCYTMLCVLLIQ